MAAFVAAAIAAGVVINAIGQKKAADAKRKAALSQANAKREQANELIKRSKENLQVTREEGLLLMESQLASFAKGGIAVGATALTSEGSPLAVARQTVNQLNRSLRIQGEEASFKADMLRAGADVDVRLARDISVASNFQIAGSFLSGAAATGAAAKKG